MSKVFRLMKVYNFQPSVLYILFNAPQNIIMSEVFGFGRVRIEGCQISECLLYVRFKNCGICCLYQDCQWGVLIFMRSISQIVAFYIFMCTHCKFGYALVHSRIVGTFWSCLVT